ncbi:Ig-like domain-containing domain [Rufibacter sp. DG15C]|uniref:Ig-like domain-containing domain n=1 Tax=Rufibacter sp. DG15C TaxID=1379909 RepID=UPI0009E73CFC|nr:Ig-like domain-containing domain [Rufibacter sp. DG15C]
MKKTFLPILSLTVALLQGCASISSPEGGDKDIVAPKLVSSYPKNGQTNVSPEKIMLTFDEAIQAPEITQQLIIAPFTENTYKTKIKDGTIELEFTEPWQANTTYSLNFRQAIGDITEKNPARQVVITFSTGATLDSGSVAGQVTQLFSPTLNKEVNVLLYKAEDTAQVQKGRPLYVTTSDSSGNYKFQNIKEGSYHIYALTETNNNLRYDSEKEQIAYLAQPIQISNKPATANLQLHLQDNTSPILASRKSFANQYEVEYNEGLASALVQDAGEEIKWQLTNNGKTLQLFPVAAQEKTWRVQVQDSAGNTKTDTVAVRLAGAKATRKNNTFTLVNGETIKPGEELKLKFDVPIKVNQPAGAVNLLLDSLNTAATATAKDFTLSENQTLLTVKLPIKAAKSVQVSIDTTKVLPFTGDPFTKGTKRVGISDKATTGSLKITLKTAEKNYLVLLMKEGKIIFTEKNIKSKTWQDLEPGKYQIRILVDKNGNGRWDNGLLKDRRLPEPVILVPDTQEVRANWEVEMTAIEF